MNINLKEIFSKANISTSRPLKTLRTVPATVPNTAIAGSANKT